jgi:hypothetical protein
LLASPEFHFLIRDIKWRLWWLFASPRQKQQKRYRWYLRDQQWHLHPRRVKDQALEYYYRRWCKVVGYKHLIFHHPVLWMYAHIDLDMINNLDPYYLKQIAAWANNLVIFGNEVIE